MGGCGGIVQVAELSDNAEKSRAEPALSTFRRQTFHYKPTTPFSMTMPGGFLTVFQICCPKKVQKFLLLSKRSRAIIPVGNLKVDSP